MIFWINLIQSASHNWFCCWWSWCIFYHWPLLRSSEVISGQHTFLFSITFDQIEMETKHGRRCACLIKIPNRYMSRLTQVRRLPWHEVKSQIDLLRLLSVVGVRCAVTRGTRWCSFIFLYLHIVRSRDVEPWNFLTAPAPVRLREIISALTLAPAPSKTSWGLRIRLPLRAKIAGSGGSASGSEFSHRWSIEVH